MQHDIGDHALLADGRSAALIDPDGNVAWLCMPRVDSPPCLLSLLDEQRGGRFTVRPHSPAARATSRRYHARSLVLETVWDAQPGRLIVDDALTFDSGALVRRLRAEGGEVPVDVVVEPAFDWGRHPAQWRVEGSNAIAVARASALTITAPGARWHAHGAATARLRIPEGATAWVQLSWGSEPALGDADPVAETLGSWRRLLPDPGRAVLAPAATAALAESELRDLLTTSAAVLCGLRSGPGGIVAAPTSSLPQWPGSSRCWDYRYCWLRDASLAGRALLTAGLTGSAADIGAFLGDVVLERWPCSVVRVDGTAPPDEQEIAHLGGYRGARPVREGNAAAA